jgi:hypothetical protein
MAEKTYFEKRREIADAIKSLAASIIQFPRFQ